MDRKDKDKEEEKMVGHGVVRQSWCQPKGSMAGRRGNDIRWVFSLLTPTKIRVSLMSSL